MRLITYVILTLSLLLVSACSASQPTISPPPPTPVPTSVITISPSPSSTASLPTANPVSTQTSELSSGQVTFKIIPQTSTVQYEVGETFINQNNRFAVAVGTTGQIEGEIFADLQNPQNSSLSTFSVDISQFKSDSSRRDNMIRQNFLESSRFPLATFVPDKIDGLPASYVEGQDYPFQVTGNLIVKEITQPATFNIVARLQGDQLSGSAQTTILMSDFGVGPISLAGILNTEDEVKISMTFTAEKQ